MSGAERFHLSAENPSPVSQTAAEDSKTPIQEIGGRITGTLRGKYDKWVQRFGGMITGLGLDTWEEYDECGYYEEEVGDISAVLIEEVTSAVQGEKKPPSELLVSRMEAMRLAKAIKAIARERAGMPKSPATSEGRSRTSLESDRAESQLTRDTAKLGILSHMKSDEKLELVNGAGRPAHVSDVARYLEEQAKPLAAMAGYEELAAMLDTMRERPGIPVGDFTDIFLSEVPEDVARHHSRLCYGGIPQQYKKEVLSQSKHKKRLFDPGIMIYALYESSTNISDLEASQKRCKYQQPVCVKPNDKKRMVASYRQFERDSFELYQLRELGTARTEAHEVQYRIGSALFSNYPDISHKWSQMWAAAEAKGMPQMRGMMQTISELIRELPDHQPYTYPAQPPSIQPVRKPGNNPETQDKYMCKDFQRTGTCDWQARTGKQCRFSHEPRKVMMAQMSGTEGDVMQLQHTMNDMSQQNAALEGRQFSKAEFKQVYEVAYPDVGTDAFANTHSELVMMARYNNEDIDEEEDIDEGAAMQCEIDNWQIT